MDWIQIGLMGAVGGLSAIIAVIASRNSEDKKVSFTISMLVCLLIFGAITTKFIKPSINNWYYSKKVSEALQDIPAYRVIKTYDPALYRQIETELKKSIEKGESEEQAITRVGSIVSQSAAKYLPVASDEILIHFSEIMIETLKQLTAIDPELTYKYLFPNEYGPVVVSKYLDKATETELLNALGEIVRTGVTDPTVVQNFSGVERLLEIVGKKLQRKHGDKVRMLAKLNAPGVDKEIASNLMIDLYQEILDLPDGQNTLLLRHMFANAK